MGSTRLPGKVLRPFCGMPMLQFQIELLKKYNLGFDIVVATTNKRRDKIISQFCERIGIECFEGSESNVFNRYRMLVKQFNFDHVIRLTGDNPLVSYSILNECINSHLKECCDLTSTRQLLSNNQIKRNVPKGLSVDIINCDSLLSVDYSILSSYEKEHLIPIFFNGTYNINVIEPTIQYSHELSIDTYQDFSRIQNFVTSMTEKGELYKYLGFDA